VDVGKNTSSSDCSRVKKSVQLRIVADSKLDVTGYYSGLFVVFSGVSGELENLSSEIFKHSSEVHWGTSTDAFSIATRLQKAANSANWELKSGFG